MMAWRRKEGSSFPSSSEAYSILVSGNRIDRAHRK